jgi:peptidoglycan-N-acetylglucosamine deacetylase
VTFSASITVDVDGVTGLPDGGRGSEQRLTSRSERLYGITRGLPRILDVLDAHSTPATFYVPGVVAEQHAAAIREVLARGHEVGHHGHTHRRPDSLGDDEQRAEVERGMAALTAVTGRRPRAYRAPEWELAPATLAALAAQSFTLDSSLMADDRPYRLDVGLLELPVHWSLDDAPYFERAADPAGLVRIWALEAAAAARERRHVTFTLHPEILGRPHRIGALDAIVRRVIALGGQLVTHETAAQRHSPKER